MGVVMVRQCRRYMRCVGVVRLRKWHQALCMVAMLCTALCTAPCPDKDHVQTGRFTYSGSRCREQRAKHPIGTVGALWVGSLGLELGREVFLSFFAVIFFGTRH